MEPYGVLRNTTETSGATRGPPEPSGALAARWSHEVHELAGLEESFFSGRTDLETRLTYLIRHAEFDAGHQDD